jgi:hypothetical protein
MEYDDDRELTQYVWDHYQHLMTEFERRVGRAILGRAKAAASQSADMEAMLMRVWGGDDDPAIEAALTEGPDAYRRRVRNRLLAEHPVEVCVNRCRRCGSVVRTPRARQCFW